MKQAKPLISLVALLASGCPPTCVAEGTMVLTPDGPRPIEELRVGDLIYSVDELSGERHSSAIVEIRSATREVGRLSLSNTSLTLTSDHPVYDPVEKRYAPAGDWLLGQRAQLMLIDEAPSIHEVSQRELFVGMSLVFDLTVESEHHNFIANGVLVHNKSPIEDWPVAGEPIAGEPVAGEPVAGEPVAGEPVAGEPVAGEPVAGEPVAGEPVAGEPVAGEPVAGEPVAGEMVEGRVLEGLSGSWSVCVDGEARSQLKRYRFEYSSASAGDWSYSESRYAELGCLGESSMTITERGAFTVAAPLAADMSLYPLDLSLNTRSLTADRESSSALLEELCALSFPAGEPVDITEQGCERLSLSPREACPVRYDVAQVVMGVLRLSDSSAPVCAAEERPDAVAEPPLSAE